MKRLVPASVSALLACAALASMPIFNMAAAAPVEPVAPRVPASVRALLSNTALSGLPIFNNPNDPIIMGHRDRQAELLNSQQAIMDRSIAENRDLTDAEQREMEGLQGEFTSLDNQINLRVTALAQNALLNTSRGRQTEPEPTAADLADANRPQNRSQSQQPARVEPRARATPGGTHGFRNLGEFAQTVRMATMRGGGAEERLRNAATTYGSEGVGADGGFAVPPDFRTTIMSRVFGEDSLIGRTDSVPISGNSLTMPIDMTTPWQASGGVQVYWTAEGAPKTESKPALQEVTVKTHTLAALVKVTDELLEDAPALDAYLGNKVPEKADFAISYAIAWGDGAGKPQGYMRSPSLVTVAAEGGQTADTVNATNLMKMWGRMPLANRATAVWLMHPDVEAMLPGMTIGNQPIYMPPGGLSNAQYGTLFGRPVIPHQVCETIGDVGDVQLVDLKSYLTIKKTGGGRDANGLRQDVSIHLHFDQDITSYRFTFRIGGQPWWSAPLDQRDGSNQQSPFITLAAR